MNVYVWERLENMSSNYHPEGGVVVVADSLDAAYELLRTKDGKYAPVPEDSDIFKTAPTEIYLLLGAATPRIFTMPDAGCC